MTINSKLIKYDASCSTFGDWAIANGLKIPKSNTPKRGDIVLFDFNHNGTSDHVGIVTGANGNTVYTVEGNTSITSNDNGGCVMKRSRTKSQINYFVRPKYTEEVTAEMVAQTALDEVGTKEKPSGSNKCKYNTWYYGREVRGSAYPWCMVFVSWCYAHVKEKETKTEPTTYKGTLPTLASKHRFGHCANRKLDCVEVAFTYDTSASSSKHWTYVAVWKNQTLGDKAAEFVKDCIKRTPKIQYDDHPNLKKKLIANKGEMPSGSLTANCSNLMAAAVYYASGKVIADKGAKNQLAQLKATGLFNIYKDGKQKKPTSNGAIYGCSRHTGMGIEYSSVIKKGDKGESVKQIQDFLKWYGIDLEADGDFGAITESAVKKFQSDNGLTADGIAEEKTLAKMKETKR